MNIKKTSILAIIISSYFISLFLIYYLDYNSSIGILREYRGLRIIYAITAGGILGMCGALLQSSLRNPLVDHYILGIGSGALFAFYLSLLALSNNVALLSVFSIIGGLSSLSLTIALAERLSGSETSYILSGLAINSLFSGLSMLLSFFVVKINPYASFHMMGSFIIADREKLLPIIVSFVIVVVGFIFLAKPLNALLISDLHAKQIGYNPRLVRLISILVSGIASSIVVSLFGLLGFIGLVSPHLSRLMLKTGDNRLVIPLSFINGSLIIYSTDFISRKLLIGVTGEIPAGAISSLIGAPFFLLLLLLRLGGRTL